MPRLLAVDGMPDESEAVRIAGRVLDAIAVLAISADYTAASRALCLRIGLADLLKPLHSNVCDLQHDPASPAGHVD